MNSTQGGEANHSGDFLERIIEGEFRNRGVFVKKFAEDGNTGDLLAPRVLLKHVPYISIYGCHSHSEFVYCERISRVIRIECKWQEQPGSVDEKFPYLLANAFRMEEPSVWFVIDGGGARKDAIEWLKREANKSSKDIAVLNISEAKQAIKRLFSGGGKA